MAKNQKKNSEGKLIVIGIGASAGGLEALQDMLSNLPNNIGNLALVIAQHLSPTYKSMLVEILRRQTSITVTEAKNGTKAERNTIYITPPDSDIMLLPGDYFQLSKPVSGTGPKPSVDTLFNSIGKIKKEYAIGIVLSGTGKDGSKGLKTIKSAGGLIIVQEPNTAKYSGMPTASIETGLVDKILPAEEIGSKLTEITNNADFEIQKVIIEDIDDTHATLEEIIKKLSEKTGTDFSNYKPSTIIRRLNKRMGELNFININQYAKYIEKDKNELDLLFNNILIGVTNFLRDKHAFDKLEIYLKKIMDSKETGDQLRIWVAGCATGEEAYSIAFLLSKLINNKLQNYNIQIFATDIDQNAITVARRGVYSKQDIEHLPEELLNSYMVKRGNTFEVIKSIRQLILFSKHDITSNPPFLKLDLISCRNLLIYFSQGLQQHVIPIFHYSLNPGGYLFLGKSETIGPFTDMYSTLEEKAKIFKKNKITKNNTVKFTSFSPKLSEEQKSKTPVQKLSIPEMVKETLYNTFDHCYVVVDKNMDVIHISGDVRMFLGINPGFMNSNILKLASQDLHIDLRALISNSIKKNETSKGDIRKLIFFEKEYFVRIIVKPLLYSEPNQVLFAVIFETYEPNSSLVNFDTSNDLSDINDHPRIIELETELEGVKEHLQNFIEELETANEELQSLNEELQSSNEELQSSNEELETSNEELQSINEELKIAYTELKAASEDHENQNRKIKQSEANSQALLNNTLQAFILINRDYKIISFNKTAQLKSELLYKKKLKQGESMIEYEPSGELEKFRDDFRKATSGSFVSGEKVVKLKNGAQRWFKYNFTPVEDKEQQINVVSYSLLDITDMKRLNNELTESETLSLSAFNAVNIGICISNENAKLIKINKLFSKIYGFDVDELVGENFSVILPEAYKEKDLQFHNDLINGEPIQNMEWLVKNKKGEDIKLKASSSVLDISTGQKYNIISVSPIEN